MFKITNIKLLKIVKYLVVKQDFKLVVTKTKDEEVFLESVGRMDFEIICLIDRQYIDDESFLIDLKRIKNIFNRLKAKLFKYKLKTAIIYTNDNQFIKDGEEIEGITVFKMVGEKFVASKLIESFNDINENISFVPNEITPDEDFLKTMNEISFYSKQKYEQVKIKRKIFNFDAHKVFTATLLIYHVIVFVFLPGSIFVDQYSPTKFINLFGASTFELVFINNQYWRPLMSGLLEYSTLSLAIDIWIFYSYGRSIRNFLGNSGYLITILLGSYITYFSLALFLPGWIFFGTGHLKAITLGSFLAIYTLKRVDWIKFHQFETRANAFIFIIVLFINNYLPHRASLILGLLAGYLITFILLSIKEQNWFDTATSTMSIMAILLFGITSWSKLPVRYEAYNKLNKEFYSAYDQILPVDSAKIKKDICNYYQRENKDCIIK